VAHCDVCCLRVSPNKDKTLPRHYLEDTALEEHRNENWR
jgi:hypothetical protein